MLVCVEDCNKQYFLSIAYWSWDEEARKQIEKPVKCSCEDGRHLVVWSDGDSHHAVVGEVEEGEEGDEEEPEEFGSCPFEADHGIHY